VKAGICVSVETVAGQPVPFCKSDLITALLALLPFEFAAEFAGSPGTKSRELFCKSASPNKLPANTLRASESA